MEKQKTNAQQVGSERSGKQKRGNRLPKNKEGKADYYAWHLSTTRIRGKEVAVCTKPGMPFADGHDPSAELLAEQVAMAPGSTLLALNCGTGLVGISATLLGAGQITLADANVVAIEAARRTLAANELTAELPDQGGNFELVVSSGTRQLNITERFDVVTLRLPKGKQLAIQYIWDAFHALRPGGELYFAGANEEGIKSYLRHMELLFGNIVLLGYRKGGRVAKAIRPTELATKPDLFQAPWLDHAFVATFTVDAMDLAGKGIKGRGVEGKEPEKKSLTICTAPGVFAGEALDPGTAHLIEQMQIEPTDTVLDLGCGNGILGAVAASYATEGDVWLVDSDINAVESARATVAANQLNNCHVLLSDCTAALTQSILPSNASSELSFKSFFDVIVTNPPFHQGKNTEYNVGEQFIQEAAQLLKDDGRFYLVANHFLNYEVPIKTHFGHCKTLYQGTKFKVLLGEKTSGEN